MYQTRSRMMKTIYSTGLHLLEEKVQGTYENQENRIDFMNYENA